MSQYEAELRLDLEGLFFLLNYHSERKELIWEDEKEYEEYIDAVLDKINDIRVELRLIQGG